MTRYIDAHRERFGVEPICAALDRKPVDITKEVGA
jgi:hypothetical protein